jgi:hypothetical protein
MKYFCNLVLFLLQINSFQQRKVIISFLCLEYKIIQLTLMENHRFRIIKTQPIIYKIKNMWFGKGSTLSDYKKQIHHQLDVNFEYQNSE